MKIKDEQTREDTEKRTKQMYGNEKKNGKQKNRYKKKIKKKLLKKKEENGKLEKWGGDKTMFAINKKMERNK